MCNEIDRPPGLRERGSAFLKRAALPALIYLGVALGLPALNGASIKYGSGFWKHALATCVTLTALVAALLVLELGCEWAVAKFQREN